MSMVFNPSYYLTNNPDVLAAVAQGVIPSAEFHFNNFGWKEGRNPNANFDTSYYLIQNPDVLEAGVNPLQHFLAFGAGEGRKPNADFVSFADFDTAAYAAANPDLAEAGIETPEALYAHFATFGFAESRPGTVTKDGEAIGTGGVPGGPTGTPGQTFTLTTAIDNLTGTANDDTFVGDAATVSAADSINGGAGNDTFNYFGAAAAVVLPQMSNIETLNLINPTATTSLNTSGIAGLKAVNYKDAALGAANLAGITLAATQTLGLDNVQTTGNVTADFGSSATAASLKMSNGSSVATANLNGTALKTLNIESSGSKANTIATLASTGTEDTVNLSGSQKLTITNALANTVKTVDASKNEGGVTVTAGNADVAFTGGAGNDKITFAAGQFNSKDTVDGGAGRDTVVINDTALTADITKGINAFKGVEVLGFGTTGATVDVSTITSVSEFLVAAGAGSTTSFTAASATDKFLVDNTAGVTTVNIGLKVGELATSVTLDNQSAANQTVGTLAISGASTINLESTGKAANTVTTLTVADNSNIVITGDKDFTITSAVAATTTGHKIDASGLSGKLTVTGSAQDDVIIGGSANDTINSSAGKDTITLGGGNDAVVYTNATHSGVTIATADTITDWSNGTNKIDVSGIAGLGGALVNQIAVQNAVDTSGAANFGDALIAAATAIGANQIGAFQFDGNTYVFGNGGGAGIAAADDIVVQLQGLHTLTADNFVL